MLKRGGNLKLVLSLLALGLGFVILVVQPKVHAAVGLAGQASSPPPIDAVTAQEGTLDLDDLGIILTPPTTAESPKLSAEDAAEAAWATGVPGDPFGSRVTLAGFSVSRLDVQLDLVWVVDYSGACVPNTGPPGNKGGDCLGDRWEVAIDANEGTWLASYSGSVLE
jgi:hypothetical protein